MSHKEIHSKQKIEYFYVHGLRWVGRNFPLAFYIYSVYQSCIKAGFKTEIIENGNVLINKEFIYNLE